MSIRAGPVTTNRIVCVPRDEKWVAQITRL